MDLPLIIFVVCILAAIGTFRLMGQPTKNRQNSKGSIAAAFGTTLATPAMLVPAAVALAVAAVFVENGSRQRWYSENPFSSPLRSYPADEVWFLVLIMAALVAGQVGLLRAAHRGIKPDGVQFWEGIKAHFFTFALAKFAIAFAIMVIAEMVELRTWLGTILFVAPSLLLAPLVGTAALHPRRPIRAIKASIERVTWDLHATARLMLAQSLLVVLIWMVYVQGATNRALASLPILAHDTTALSFNPLTLVSPQNLGTRDNALIVVLVGAMLVVSTAFMQCHFKRVMARPEKSSAATAP